VLPGNVNTTSDLMSIALQAEREAIRRYTELAEKMQRANNQSSAALFQRMVEEEVEHERLLLEWMAEEGIKENAEVPVVKWSDPNISTTYNNEARDPYQSSPYRALAFAVHNEEIAFRFYTHVAAESENETVRKYAEVLAREELGHAALLRAERRRAYHAERDAKIVEPRLNPKDVRNETDLLTIAIHIDHFLMKEMADFSADSHAIDSLLKEMQGQLNNHKIILHDVTIKEKGTSNKDITRKLEEIDSYNERQDNTTNTADEKLRRLCGCCDRSFSFYDAVVETPVNEKVMLLAQNLTSLALNRIAILKQALGEQCEHVA